MRGHGLAAAAVLAVALAARVPLFLLSGLPLNIDAFAQVAIAEEFQATGRWSLAEGVHSYNRKLPVLPLLLATAAGLTGTDPLTLATPLMVAVGLGGLLAVYALVHALVRRRAAAAAAALALGLLGPFLFLGSTLIKEALGLALLPVLLLLFLRRTVGRNRVLAAVLLLLLPLVHHLVTAMAFAFVGFLVLLAAVRAHWEGRWAWRPFAADVLLGPGLFPVAVAYYTAVRMEFFRDVWNPDEVALFLSVALLMAAAAVHLASDRRARPWFALSKGRRIPSLLDQKAVVIAGAFLLVLANAVRPLVPGTVPTSPVLLLAAAAYVPLAALALVGLNRFRMSRDPVKAVPIALLLAPLTFLVFALLRGLDPLSHLLAYRSVDFVDFGLVLVLGTALARRRPVRRHALLAVAVGGLLVATLPLAYATEDAFQVQNTTYRYEMAAFGHVARAADGSVSTDQRMGAVLSWYFGASTDGTLPLRLRAGTEPPPGALLLVEGNWATRGAQVHPLPFQRVDPARLDGLVATSDLLYHGGDGANPVHLLRVRP